ncbi:putative RNA-directed DNA polymerase, partial [Tanacetum coccineum]
GSSSGLNLSFGDPLYLHPNDTSGSPIVTVKLTGTENYKMWSIAMTFALKNHNKLGFIDGSCKRDIDNPALANQWDMCNSVVVTWILNSLSFDLFAGAIYAKSACEMWNDLKETYDKVDGSAINLMLCYLAIRSNLFTREPLPLVKNAFAVISGEESHKNVTSVRTTKPAATAFAAKTFDNNKRRFNNNNFKRSGLNSNSNNMGPNPNLKCTNCNKIGHTVDICFELVGYSTGYVKRNFNANTRPVSSNNVSVDVHANSISSNNATSSNSPVSLSNEQLARLMNLLNENDVSTANANMAVLITKIGESKINNDITLNDVLVVPEYTVSLLLVHKLSRDSKLFVGFDESSCYIQDLKANKNVGIGKQFNALYLFDVDNACKIVSNICIASCFVSKTLWHQKLGHSADQVLNVLKTTLNLDSHSTSDHLCDTCNKAKQTREPFPLNDFSRAVWVYMLKGKDDVYDSIISFVQMMLNQFETNVKTFRSDNRTEFVNNRLQNFLNEKRILHQTTYVYTHQQNGIAERKHRHLLNAARPLMFQGKLPLYLWSECILTAIYIINRIPSSALSGRVSSNDDDTELSPDIQGNDDSEATSMDENNTHHEGTVPNETDFVNDFYENSEFNSEVEDLPVHTVRRSSRQTKLPTSLNDFVIEGKVKYGVEKVVNYANLNHENFCFASGLNKSIKLICYENAILDNNWIDAMKAEIKA